MLQYNFHIIRLSVAVLITFFSFAVAAYGESKKFYGNLVPSVEVINAGLVTFVVPAATPNQIESACCEFSNEAVINAGKLPVIGTRFLIIDEGSLGSSIFVDLNGDHKFSKQEKFIFEKQELDTSVNWPLGSAEGQARFEVPVGNKAFKALPFRIVLFSKSTSMHRNASRSIEISAQWLASGTVDLEGVRLKVLYEYNAENDSVDPRNGWLAVDANLDGVVNEDPFSGEATTADSEDVVFNVQGVFLVTELVDLTNRRIVMSTRTEREYSWNPIRVGSLIPQVAFQLGSGKRLSLRDKGLFTLLVVWSPSCGICIQELDKLASVAKDFGRRKLRVVSITGNDQFQSAKAAVEAHSIPWQNVASAEGVEFAKQRLRISSWPTHILINPEGIVESLDQIALSIRLLANTLDNILPKRK